MVISLPDDFRHECVAEEYNLECFAAELIMRAARLDQLAKEVDAAKAMIEVRERDLARREDDVLAASRELEKWRKENARRSAHP